MGQLTASLHNFPLLPACCKPDTFGPLKDFVNLNDIDSVIFSDGFQSADDEFPVWIKPYTMFRAAYFNRPFKSFQSGNTGGVVQFNGTVWHVASVMWIVVSPEFDGFVAQAGYLLGPPVNTR